MIEKVAEVLFCVRTWMAGNPHVTYWGPFRCRTIAETCVHTLAARNDVVSAQILEGDIPGASEV
jgi:hypothetical protein